jgi:Fe-Mn family superoxide dismutase
MTIKAKPLPYANDALEPTISSHQLAIHFEKHYLKYVEKTNKATKDTALADLDLDTLMKLSGGHTQALVSQIWNHECFWDSMLPGGVEMPAAVSELAIDSYGDVETFKKAFEDLTEKFFGSGWIWLVLTEENDLKWVTTQDGENPITQNEGHSPLLCCDLWEHAYYIDYEADRKQFLSKWYEELANWAFASSNIEHYKEINTSVSLDSKTANQSDRLVKSISKEAFTALSYGGYPGCLELMHRLAKYNIRVI